MAEKVAGEVAVRAAAEFLYDRFSEVGKTLDGVKETADEAKEIAEKAEANIPDMVEITASQVDSIWDETD